MTVTAKIKQQALALNPRERLRLVQDIWDSLVFENPQSVRIPTTHKQLIDQRLEEHVSDPRSSITLAEAKGRIRRHLTNKRKK